MTDFCVCASLINGIECFRREPPFFGRQGPTTYHIVPHARQTFIESTQNVFVFIRSIHNTNIAHHQLVPFAADSTVDTDLTHPLATFHFHY